MDLSLNEIFCVRLPDQYLLYAPRQGLSALLNRAALRAVWHALRGEQVPGGELAALVEVLQAEGEPLPQVRRGPLGDPLFLGLIPTRGCNLDCQYCDFAAPKADSPQMSAAVARAAIDAYTGLLRSSGRNCLEIHFFGGEPFTAWDSVFFAVEYARQQAAQQGLEVRFEVITNGMFDARRARWIADRFDSVVLSLDGFAPVQERQRPSLNRQPTFPTLLRNVRILANGPAELALRACITAENVGQMPDYAVWAAGELHPGSVCFETLAETPLSRQAGLCLPDSLQFAQNFFEAKIALEAQGIETVLSTDPLGGMQNSFCPVGKDALIVSPDGSLDACYWLPEQWQAQGFDLHLGEVGEQGFEFAPQAVARARQAAFTNKAMCAGCLCQYHCAGACHVRRGAAPTSRNYTEVCYQTRAVKVARLLHELDRDSLAARWLQDRQAVEQVVYAVSDRLEDAEGLQ